MNVIKSLSIIIDYANYKINKLKYIDNLKIIDNRINNFLIKIIKIYVKNNTDLIVKKNIYIYFNKIKFLMRRIINIKHYKITYIKKDISKKYKYIDVTLPGRNSLIGNLHPITYNINYIRKYFFKLGFNFLTGPEIEDSYNNFDALNIPQNHPARSEKDSFWIKKPNILLRTHTTSVQIRFLKDKKPPLKYISIGKVYRCDNDPTHTPMFHQLEGVVVDKRVTISNLKYLVQNFLLYYFNKNNLKMRYRPSYFPFTVPSIEVDIYSKRDNKWLEILGGGLLHPNVLINIGLDHNKDKAIAFGIGIERLMMLKYNLNDIRILYENNLRFLKKMKYI